MKGGSVHILASKRDGTFYIGVTGDLPGRMAELPMLALFPDSPGATASKCWSGTSTTAASDLRHRQPAPETIIPLQERPAMDQYSNRTNHVSQAMSTGKQTKVALFMTASKTEDSDEIDKFMVE